MSAGQVGHRPHTRPRSVLLRASQKSLFDDENEDDQEKQIFGRKQPNYYSTFL